MLSTILNILYSCLKQKNLLGLQRFLTLFVCFLYSLEKSICTSDYDLSNLEWALKKQKQLVFEHEKVEFYQREKLEPKVKIFLFENVSVNWRAEQIGAT